MFEVGERRTRRLEAHEAFLETAPANPTADTDKHPHANRFSNFKTRRARLLACALVAGLGIGAVEEAARLSGTPELDRLARFAGFGIDQVVLEGHRMSFDNDVFEALDLANVRTFAALDTAAAKARIERLPWIDKAELSRVYPGRLEVRVSERKPYALWHRADRRYLIDKTGRVLAAVSSGGTLPKLPRFAGEGAAEEAASFMQVVARYPELANRFAEAERVSERRWTLRLSNGATLVLPADNEVGALEELSRDPELMAVAIAGGRVLDFRGPGRVAIRTEDADTGTGSNTGAASAAAGS